MLLGEKSGVSEKPFLKWILYELNVKDEDWIHLSQETDLCLYRNKLRLNLQITNAGEDVDCCPVVCDAVWNTRLGKDEIAPQKHDSN